MLLRAIIAGLVVAAVSQIADRYPRLGALLLTLPIVSIVAFVAVWWKDQDLATVSKLSRETLVLVPLGLPLFIPLAISQRLGLGFWGAFALGLILASTTIGLWFAFGPKLEN
ncbi:hypothetical protein LOC68_08555 [Blastopirellula sp. JC732]|uniref:DUF3147 family protein n=1 Tax=Blastopirellula sediminis TaxID=2894196 RepID=A0A9X1MMY5_9BACT|nr:hypothetical protein [Blastopirellula sediminis]MCC9608779.1 hypothetical protein [Blastopirellula sediminis]MCC9628444.1 hypothetical protein [Blastopirellula sediminis]